MWIPFGIETMCPMFGLHDPRIQILTFTGDFPLDFQVLILLT